MSIPYIRATLDALPEGGQLVWVLGSPLAAVDVGHNPLPDDAYDWYEMGNMDTQVDQVVRGRSAAAALCDRAAELLPGSRAALARAAASYREEVEIARDVFGAFQPAFNGKDDERVAWLSDPARRKAGANAIRRMLVLEQAAVAMIEDGVNSTDNE